MKRPTSIAASVAAVRATMRAPLFASLWAVFAAAVPSVSLQAQIAGQPHEAIVGSVRDTAGLPLANAEVYISRRETPVRTDSNGAFRLTEARSGDYWLYIRKLGYSPSRQSLSVQNGNAARKVTVLLTALPEHMSTEQITAESGYGEGVGSALWFMEDDKAWGRLITRDRIAKTKAPTVSFLLRQYIPNFPVDFQEAQNLDLSESEAEARQRNFGLPATFRNICLPSVVLNADSRLLRADVDRISVQNLEAVEFVRANAGDLTALNGVCGKVRLWIKTHADASDEQIEVRE